MTQWPFQKLLENTSSSFRYYIKNPLSMITLSEEHFHSTTHVKHILLSQLQYAREFMRSMREVLRRSHFWPSYYFIKYKR